MVMSLCLCVFTCTLTNTGKSSLGGVCVIVCVCLYLCGREHRGGVWSGVSASVFRSVWEVGRREGGAALPQSRTVRWAGTKQLDGGAA